MGWEHWIISGDFTLIRSLEERKGGIITLNGVSASFNEAIEDLHLVDVHTPKKHYT